MTRSLQRWNVPTAVVVLVVGALSFTAARTAAQPAQSDETRTAAQPAQSDEARADALYKEAGARIDEGKPEEAIPLLEDSLRLKHTALGARYALADCYERTGKPARALSLFREVESEAKAAGKARLESDARDRAAKLVPKLVMDVPAPIPAIPTLADAPAPPPILLARPPIGESAAATRTWSTQRIVGLALGGVGLTGALVGTIFGAETLSTSGEAKSEHDCTNGTPTVCNSQGYALYQAAGKTAIISNVAFAIGGAALFAGVITFVTAPAGKPGKPSSSMVSAGPAVGMGTVGLSLHGEW